MIIFLIILSALTYLYVSFKISRRHIEACADKIPGDKALPIIGNLWSYRKAKTSTDLIKLLIESAKKYKERGICRLWAGHYLVVAVWDPKYVETIANSPNGASKGIIYSTVLGGYPKGVFIASDTDAKWRALRKPLTRTLSKYNINNGYHDIFVNLSEKYVRYIKENAVGREIELHDEMNNFAADVMAETFLGINSNEIYEKKFNFLKNGDEFFERSVSFKAIAKMTAKSFGLKRLSTFLTDKDMEQNSMNMDKFLDWALVERMKKLPTEAKGKLIYYTDFILERKKEKNLSREYIKRELLDVTVAGSDTSSVLGSSILLFLAMFPEIQEEVYKEQMSIFNGNSLQKPTPDDIASMEYLNRVIKETLRFCSPGVILKQASGDIQLDNYTIPKGTPIIMLLDMICHDERHWEKPHSFYPDHFLPEKEAERSYYTFPAFGAGPRICPGSSYAFHAAKVIISYIIRNFKLSTSMKFEDIDIQYHIMRTLKSYNVKFEERQKVKG